MSADQESCVRWCCQPFSFPSLNLSHVGVCVPRNPTPGQIINRPNGSDVYKGVLKDYIGDVSAAV